VSNDTVTLGFAFTGEIGSTLQLHCATAHAVTRGTVGGGRGGGGRPPLDMKRSTRSAEPQYKLFRVDAHEAISPRKRAVLLKGSTRSTEPAVSYLR